MLIGNDERKNKYRKCARELARVMERGERFMRSRLNDEREALIYKLVLAYLLLGLAAGFLAGWVFGTYFPVNWKELSAAWPIFYFGH